MKEFKILVYNVKTGTAFMFLKRFPGSYQADQYCMKRSRGMYIVTFSEC